MILLYITVYYGYLYFLFSILGVCEGWGDPHYITVDGLYYSYQGNCTYVLVEEIRTKYHLKIYIDNVFCDIGEDVSCPRSIIISFGSQTVKLINHNPAGGRANLEVKLFYSLAFLCYYYHMHSHQD